MSRAAARDSTKLATTTAWIVRAVIKVVVLGAFAQITEASTNMLNAQSAIGRRPNRSDNGPIASCKIPFVNRKPESKNCTEDGEAPKCSWIAGMDGKKIFIDEAPRAANITSVAMVGGVVGSRNRALGSVDITNR